MRYQNKQPQSFFARCWEDMSEVRKHLLNSQKELLLTVRAIVDLVIEKTEYAPTINKARKVTIK
jgi:hypothetical protein